MIANSKYTALEILQAAGVPEPEAKIGKVKVRIGGLSISSPTQLIKVQKGVERFDVLVGKEGVEVVFEAAGDKLFISEAAKVALKAKGKASTEKAAAIQEAKAEPAEVESK